MGALKSQVLENATTEMHEWNMQVRKT